MSTPNPLKRTRERASRIALDYYKRGDRMVRWKRWLALLGAVVVGVWLAAGYVRHDESRYSPGKLAWSHATWDQDCAACHVDFSPIRGDAWAVVALGKSNAIDRQCQHCHPGPEHHPTQLPAETSCASCHTEHQGRDSVLTRTADQTCTDCHADLKAHSTVTVKLANVSHFDKEHHPEFRSIAADPGTLKFSHRRHLALGLTFGPLDRADAWTLEKIPKNLREQYQGFVKDNQLLQLDCAACHQSDDRQGAPTAQGALGTNGVPPRSAGDYLRPIVFETHCQACHPLNFKPPRAPLGEPDSSEAIPHRLTSSQIDQFLERAYAALILQQDPSLWDSVVVPPRELPNQPAIDDNVTVRRQRERGISLASSHLHGVCLKCHTLADANPLPQVEAVKVPQVWLTHARFDHKAHQFKTCRDCHANGSLADVPPAWTKDLSRAEPIESTAALDNGEVLIPGIQKCLECHAPSAASADHPQGGARFDCVECHWYHPANDAHAKQAADTEAPMSLGAWYQGRAAKFDGLTSLLRASTASEGR